MIPGSIFAFLKGMGHLNYTKILLAEEEEWISRLIEDLLKPRKFCVLTAKSGNEALDIAEREKPDLILLDTRLPPDGFEVLKKLREKYPLGETPIIMLTREEREKVKVFSLGASDFVGKPFSQVELLARIKVHLKYRDIVTKLHNAENVFIYIAKTVEMRELYTEKHADRVKELAVKIAEGIGLGDDDILALEKGAYLHDIGKIAIPDRILLKEGPLTEGEFSLIKKHTIVGEAILSPLSTFRNSLDAIKYHHERWDGKGYPEGIGGEDIPLLARILAIADSYEAMRSDRPYRRKKTEGEIIRELREGSGKQWDPHLLEFFIELLEKREFSQ
jgi:putative two-component system response regulator